MGRSRKKSKKFLTTEPPRSEAVVPRGWTYFRQWRLLRWFLLALVPLALSTAFSLWRQPKQIVPAILVAVMGTVVTSILFVALASGSSSSNWGTYTRSQDPFGYWRDVVILAAVYVWLSFVGWFAK